MVVSSFVGVCRMSRWMSVEMENGTEIDTFSVFLGFFCPVLNLKLDQQFVSYHMSSGFGYYGSSTFNFFLSVGKFLNEKRQCLLS